MKFTQLILTLCIVGASSTFAQSAKQEPCANAQTQTEMNICWGNEYKAADAKLNQTYRQLVAMLDAEEKVQLKNVQTAWLKYRDANCEFVGDQYKGGTIRPMIVAMCLADMTTNRTTVLKAQVKDRDQ